MKKVPRIIKIHSVEGFRVYCAFNSGEHRIIDFEPLFLQWDLQEGEPGFPITRPEVFRKLQLINGTLTWPEVIQSIKLSNGMEFKVPYELDPVVLYEKSEPDIEREPKDQIGTILRKAREAAGLTQAELAKRSGTTKNYISRIENNRSGIGLDTLRKIIELGLDKQLEIKIS